MAMCMPASILQTKCTVLVYTTLQMDIGMRVVGLKEKDKGSACIRLEMATLNQVIGKMVFLALIHDILCRFLMPYFQAVEEARRIAEKAVAAKNVDGRVNRVVASANKAANAARVAAAKAVQSCVHHYDDPTLVIV